jgi:hypothetical protein
MGFLFSFFYKRLCAVVYVFFVYLVVSLSPQLAVAGEKEAFLRLEVLKLIVV